MAIVIDAPRPGDRERLREILLGTEVFRPEEVDVALEVFDDALKGDPRDYVAAAARDGDQLVGWAAWGPTPCTRGTFDLYWIAVDARTHRRGLGRQLMAFAEQDMRDRGGRLCIIETSALPIYLATREFYLRLGYAEEARIRDYYKPGDDRVIYTRRLEQA